MDAVVAARPLAVPPGGGTLPTAPHDTIALMRRLAFALQWTVLTGALHIHLHIHHHIKGPPFDYAGLAAAAAASWFGVPGPGEPVLIAAGVLAGQHKLDLASVLVVAFLSAVGGAVAGWLLGRAGGRRLLGAGGPLRRLRLRVLEHGDHIFERHPVLGILLAPAPMAGIHRVGPGTFLATTGISAALWSAGIGVGAYFAGPPIVDAVSDEGTIALVALIVLVVGSVGAEMVRRRRRAARETTTG
jgi:membrane protein DedA with SNARE-associated domain